MKHKFSGTVASWVISAVALGAGSTAATAQDQDSEYEELVFEEIVVVARKKEEALQSTPVTVEVVGIDEIAGRALRGLEDVAKLTPGLTFDNEFGRSSNRPVIRGQANILGASGVAIFIDGVLINGSVADYDLNDLQRIEVVKGPQSALYGRNTYSGAINYVTKSPGDEPRARIQARVAEDNDFELSASLSGPIVEGKVAGGISARYYDFGGAWRNENNGEKIGGEQSISVSGNLVFTPSEDLRVRARAYYGETKDDALPNFATSADENNCLFDNGSLYGGGGRYYCGTITSRASSFNGVEQTVLRPGLEIDTFQASVSIDYDLSEDWSLASITAYNQQDSTSVIDGDYQPTRFQVANFTPNGFPLGFPFPAPFGFATSAVDFTFSSAEETHDFQQELRLTYTGDNYELLLGGYYFNETSKSNDTRQVPADAEAVIAANYGAQIGVVSGACAVNPICSFVIPFGAPALIVPRNFEELETENKALFARLEVQATDRLTLSAEARYQEEDLKFDIIEQDLGGPITNTETTRASFSSFNPRFTVDYQVNDNSLLYGIVARGNKPGGFNGILAIRGGVPTFDEENAWSFEIGSKNVVLDGQGTFNIAAFYNQIDGYQLTQNVRSNANTTSAIVNAGDVDLYGVEVSFLYRPRGIEGLTITANYAFTDSEFQNGFDENQGVLNDVADDGLVNQSTGLQFPNIDGDNTSLFGDITGNALPRQSEHQGYINFDYRRPMSNDWEWFIGADMSYESERFTQVHNLAENGEAVLVSARLGFSNEKYSITFWGRNLTGENTSPFILRYADGAQSFRRSFVGIQRRDTFFGITAAANF